MCESEADAQERFTGAARVRAAARRIDVDRTDDGGSA
jgi:hypothetical protein